MHAAERCPIATASVCCLQAKRRAEVTSRRTAVFMVASAAVVAGLYLGYRYDVMQMAEVSDSNGSSRDSAAGQERNASGSSSSNIRRDISGYMRGLFRTWSR